MLSNIYLDLHFVQQCSNNATTLTVSQRPIVMWVLSLLGKMRQKDKEGPITQVCSGKTVFEISTFLYRFLCAELKK
jgi:hypothetical protein